VCIIADLAVGDKPRYVIHMPVVVTLQASPGALQVTTNEPPVPAPDQLLVLIGRAGGR
jgi:hypothetical protein